MRIAQVAPLHESVPPKLYGGTERVVAYLTDELVRQGHEVTLFASADSVSLARHVAVGGPAARPGGGGIAWLARHLVLLDRVFDHAHEFDVIHYHIDYLHFPLSRRLGPPHLTTLHGRLDLDELDIVYGAFPAAPVVSISLAQRTHRPQLNWRGNVYHGLPKTLYRPGDGRGGYLAFLGRISTEKRPDRAIRLAERAGRRLVIAAKVDMADRDYFESEIRPLLASPWVEFIGEIGEAEKNDFLGNAEALLFPIDWPEPFGLVMIESLACGTPVIAFRRGSVAEIVEHGRTGFVVEDERQALAAIDEIGAIAREECRGEFERRFSAERMAADYARLYEQETLGAGGATDERAA